MRDQPAMLQSTTGETMALEGVTARGAVRGLLFELTVEQRYRNPSAANIELEYNVTEGSTVIAEMAKCIAFCKSALNS